MPAGNRTRYTAIIADDHEIVRAGLAAALRKPGLIEADGLEIVAEAAHGLQAIELVKRHRPDLLILDVSMPLASGAEIIADIKRWSRDTRIVAFTAVTSPGLLKGLVDAGVEGLFAKAGDNAEMFSRLPLILRGGRYVSDVLARIIGVAAEPPPLTARERQTLNMVISGKTNAEIARLMGISPRTVEKHRANLMTKLDVRTTVELMARALKDGLIEDHRLP